MKNILILAAVVYSSATAQMISPNLGTRDINNTDALVGPEIKRVTFYGLTSLNGANENVIDNLTATGRLGVFISLSDKLSFNIGANLLNANPTKGVKRDSVDFNSLMFPETGNFGFLFNPAFRISQNSGAANSWYLDATYAYRKVAIDSPDVNFKINSINLAVRYQWNYPTTTDTFRFIIRGYWNLFNIPLEDVKKFNSVLNDPIFIEKNKHAQIYSIGLKTEVQYKSFIFFADLRRNLHTRNFDDNNPLKGTKFNIGFATAFSLKSF